MREIIKIVEGIADESDEELFRLKHCDALAVKIHRLFHIPIVAIVDGQTGEYRRVCNRVADRYFITIDGEIDKNTLFKALDIDPNDTRWIVKPISEHDLEVYLHSKGITPKNVQTMDRAENAARRLLG